MWPLLACSIVSVSVTFERFFFWAQIRKRRNRKLTGTILHLAENGEWDQGWEQCRGSRDHVIRMLAAGIQHRDYDMGTVMAAEAGHCLKKMTKYMTVLDTMITVSPLLGILGTVLGIITSFKMLGAGGVADPKLVTGGIAQALVTTAAGLTISIATVFPYNYFKSRIEDAIHVMEHHATNLEVACTRLRRAGLNN